MINADPAAWMDDYAQMAYDFALIEQANLELMLCNQGEEE